LPARPAGSAPGRRHAPPAAALVALAVAAAPVRAGAELAAARPALPARGIGPARGGGARRLGLHGGLPRADAGRPRPTDPGALAGGGADGMDPHGHLAGAAHAV